MLAKTGGIERYGLDVDEVTQHIFLKWMEKRDRTGKPKGQTVDQAVVDYLRERIGDSRLDSYKAKTDFYFAETFEERKDKREVTNIIIKSALIRKYLKDRDRAMMILKYEWGMNHEELADIFGISSSRVSQAMKGIRHTLAMKMASEKSEL